jgi:hypothetical protein
MLFADSATTQAPLSILGILAREDIIFRSFPPHMTHLLQPVDVWWALVQDVLH